MSALELFIYSAIPFTEQRVTIPLGILVYGFEPIYITILCFLGALTPAPFILLFFKKTFDIALRFRLLNPITGFVEKKVRKKSAKVEIYRELALIMFVGLPLPGTGVWTGSVIAALLGLDLKKSLLCIIAGNLISALILLLISVLFPAILGSIKTI